MVFFAVDLVHGAAADMAAHAAFLFDLVLRIENAAAEIVYSFLGEILRDAGPVFNAGVGTVNAGVVVGGGAGRSELADRHCAGTLGMLDSHLVGGEYACLICNRSDLLSAADDSL